jgi:hypothetical protein
MKYPTYAMIVIASALTIGCNKEKARIDDSNAAMHEAIDERKDEIDADAKYATEQTAAAAAIEKARIEAERGSMQAQLDADKKKADAEAEAEKARVDAQPR